MCRRGAKMELRPPESGPLQLLHPLGHQSSIRPDFADVAGKASDMPEICTENMRVSRRVHLGPGKVYRALGKICGPQMHPPRYPHVFSAYLWHITCFPSHVGKIRVSILRPSRPGELHPEPLTDPDMTLSRHRARAARERLSPFIQVGGFLPWPVDPTWIGPPTPFAPLRLQQLHHYCEVVRP